MAAEIAVYTLTYDRLEYTKRTFRGLQETVGVPFDHYVVDNGSLDGTQLWLPRQNLACVIHNHRNLGISRASNEALDAIRNSGIPYRYILKVDNDCEFVHSGWLQVLLDVLAEKPAILSPFVEGLRENKDGCPRIKTESIAGHQVGWTNSLGGICVIAPAEAYRSFRFAEDKPYIWGAMGELCAKSGLPCGYVEDVSVRHMDTTTGQEAAYPDYFIRRRRERTAYP